MSSVREKSFRRTIASLDAVFAFIAEYVAEFGIGETTAYALQFAIEEIFTNLVKYDANASPTIPIRLAKDDSRITAEVINTGGQNFDMTAIHGFDDPPTESDGGGLGLQIVRKLVDEFRYDYANGTGIITIVMPLED